MDVKLRKQSTFSSSTNSNRAFVKLIFISMMALVSPLSFAASLFEIVSPVNTRTETANSENSWAARLNHEAFTAKSVDLTLPSGDLLKAQRMPLDDPSAKLHMFYLKGESGSVTVGFAPGGNREVTIHRVRQKEVFKGVENESGITVFSRVDINSYICDEFDHIHVSRANDPVQFNFYDPNPESITESEALSLQSRPGASKTLYLDYLGGTLTGTQWNATYNGGQPIVYNKFNLEGGSDFSQTELLRIYAGWAEVAEDYAPFDVNVTTSASVFNATAGTNRSRIIATDSQDWLQDDVGFAVGGVAYLNSFGNTSGLADGWTFNLDYSSKGMTHSHESGHQMGLRHDGLTTTEYYSGHGNWGPIMGAPFGKDFVQWNNGDYTNANRFENDFSIITGVLGTVTDDAGNSNGTATPIASDDFIGLITPQGISSDVDVYSFSLTSSKTVNITVRTLYESNIPFNGGVNLSARIRLLNSSGRVIAEQLASSVSQSNNFVYNASLPAGTYYLRIEPLSYDSSPSTGFSEYGNGGFYQVVSNLSSLGAPDLQISSGSLMVSDTTLIPNQSVNLQAVVTNQGDFSAPASILRFYLSTDSNISTSDTQLSSVSSPALGASSSSSVLDVDVNAPIAVGTYWIGACVDTVSGESDTTNNCSTGTQVTVTLSADSFENDNTFDLANSIANKETQNHNIHVVGDRDWLTFSLTSTVDDFEVETDGPEGGDTLIRLYDENLVEITSNDDGVGNGLYSKISMSNLAAGTYYILVEESGNDATIPSYTVTLNFIEDDILAFMPAIIAGIKKEPEAALPPEWGTISEICCSVGSATLTVTIDGKRLSSSLASCSASPSFQGYTVATSGSKSVSARLSSSSCGTLDFRFGVPFRDAKRYLFLGAFQNGAPVIQVFEGDLAARELEKGESTGMVPLMSPVGLQSQNFTSSATGQFQLRNKTSE